MPASDPERVPVSSCLVCGARELAPVGRRSDGVAVLRCAACGMGFVESHPPDVSAIYDDAYFDAAGGAPSKTGYAAYQLAAAHSTRWAAALAALLCPTTGDVLDVGCADGDLLAHLPARLGRSGIEPNAGMAARCRARGIEMLGPDILSPALPGAHAGRFVAVTAIAVLEHVVDVVGALEQVRRLLAPEGVLLFEVPVLSDRVDSGVWFRSSLEHVYYPTEQGLHSLVRRVFGRPVVGGELAIQGYGPTFVGLVGNGDAAHAAAGELYARAVTGPAAGLTAPDEVAFRFLFDVVHAARRGPDELALLPRVDPGVLEPDVRARLAALWGEDASGAARLAEARDHYRTQAENWEREAGVQRGMNEELRRWVAEVERARDQFRERAERRFWRR